MVSVAKLLSVCFSMPYGKYHCKNEIMLIWKSPPGHHGCLFWSKINIVVHLLFIISFIHIMKLVFWDIFLFYIEYLHQLEKNPFWVIPQGSCQFKGYSLKNYLLCGHFWNWKIKANLRISDLVETTCRVSDHIRLVAIS